MRRMVTAAGTLLIVTANLKAQTPAPSGAACEALKALRLPGVRSPNGILRRRPGCA
ncbi:MAG: hypothetical protein JOZ22_07200 [Acidobacteriia bacterium]|nr:hypothetical protein [Terriglobia bacterium]